jgi:hypothetical protein
MPTDPVPFRICRSAEEVEAVTQVLQEAGIPFRAASNAAHFDLTQIGAERDAQIQISVRPEEMAAATKAVAEAEENAFEKPDDDHYFHDYEDYELGQVLVTDFEWSAHDVATARAILKDRGILPTEEAIKRSRDEYLATIRQGTQSSRILLGFGFIAATFGIFNWGIFPIGLISAAIGWSFMTMTKTDPLGVTYHIYDERSRKEGRVLYRYSLIVLAIWGLSILWAASVSET